jgi:hypothetical protein
MPNPAKVPLKDCVIAFRLRRSLLTALDLNAADLKVRRSHLIGLIVESYVKQVALVKERELCRGRKPTVR